MLTKSVAIDWDQNDANYTQSETPKTDSSASQNRQRDEDPRKVARGHTPKRKCRGGSQHRRRLFEDDEEEVKVERPKMETPAPTVHEESVRQLMQDIEGQNVPDARKGRPMPAYDHSLDAAVDHQDSSDLRKNMRMMGRLFEKLLTKEPHPIATKYGAAWKEISLEEAGRARAKPNHTEVPPKKLRNVYEKVLMVFKQRILKAFGKKGLGELCLENQALELDHVLLKKLCQMSDDEREKCLGKSRG